MVEPSDGLCRASLAFGSNPMDVTPSMRKAKKRIMFSDLPSHQAKELAFLDTDNDGFLEEDEVVRMVETFQDYNQGRLLMSMFDPKWSHQLRQLDADGDGYLDANEVSKAVTTLMKYRADLRRQKLTMCGVALFSILMVSATFGLAYVLVDIQKDIITSGGRMLDRSTGSPVQFASSDFAVEDGVLMIRKPSADIAVGTAATTPGSTASNDHVTVGTGRRDLPYSTSTNLCRACGSNRDQACSTSVSSQHYVYGPWIAVDGVTSYDVAGTFTGTATPQIAIADNPSPWWKVDFGVGVVISRVIIYNRLDANTKNIEGFEVWIGNSPDYYFKNTMCYVDDRVGQRYVFNISCTGGGRYLWVHLPNPSVLAELSLTEVEVYPAAPGNLARTCGTQRNAACNTRMSSTDSIYAGGNCVDGDTSSSLCATNYNQVGGPWWMVDLETSRNIIGGRLFARPNDGRVELFEVWVGNYPGIYSANSLCYSASVVPHLVSPFIHAFTCVGSGRYVFIHTKATYYPLVLNEVELYAAPVEPTSGPLPPGLPSVQGLSEVSLQGSILTARGSTAPVRTSAFKKEAGLSSNMTDEDLSQLESIYIAAGQSSATGSIYAVILGFTRFFLQSNSTANIVILETAIGQLVLDGTTLYPATTSIRNISDDAFKRIRSNQVGTGGTALGVKGFFTKTPSMGA